ncbi:MAG: regulatory iron-sulfur-containing complex subunit RicT [Bacteroidota bacterium]
MNFDISVNNQSSDVEEITDEDQKPPTNENPYGTAEPIMELTKNCPCTAIIDKDYTKEFNNSNIKYCNCYDGIPEFVEVLFKCKRKNIFKNSNQLKFQYGEIVVVEVENGLDIGTVSACGRAADDKLRTNYNNSLNINLKVLRHATKDDYEKHMNNLEDDKYVTQKAKEMILKYDFEMKITDAEWQYDHQRLTIYFTAPSRIDFRELVKELARTFKTRIELRQISTREEAKRMGGMGSCGRVLCCSTFSCDFNHVTLEHARTQQLSNNVAKLSGYCGRLKCCLLYEYNNYVEAFKRYPPLNSQLVMPEGLARIIKADVFKDIFYLYIESVSIYKTITLAEVEELMNSGRLVVPKDEIAPLPVDFDENLEELKKLEEN